jgi:hypothetical protein
MAIVRIFPKDDTTIYTEYPTLNSGIDAILDLSKTNSVNNPSYSATSRILIEFDQSEIQSIITDYIQSTASISASLGLYLAEATAIPVDYTLEFLAVSESWDPGTGRFSNVPITTDGACWVYKDVNFTPWNSSSFASDVTASFTSDNGGGANWYLDNISTETFDDRRQKDIYVDVSAIVNQWISGSIPNNGFIIKSSDSIEFNANIYYTLMYFSVETNTIYPPYLDLKWDDSVYNPDTSSMSLIPNTNIVTSLQNNPGIFDNDEIIQLKVNARPQYPLQIFATSSIYVTGNYLPPTSYWRLRDVDTNIIVIDFDTNFTKISADNTGNFFSVYMSALEPERYYSVEIRIDFSGSIHILKDDYYFKVTQ